MVNLETGGADPSTSHKDVYAIGIWWLRFRDGASWRE
jgi:hypothetical protein